MNDESKFLTPNLSRNNVRIRKIVRGFVKPISRTEDFLHFRSWIFSSEAKYFSISHSGSHTAQKRTYIEERKYNGKLWKDHASFGAQRDTN